MRKFLIPCFLLTIQVNVIAQILEAENGTRAGTQVSTQREGYSGTGYVTGFDADGDKIALTANISMKGVYDLYIRYASPSGQKFNFVYVNDENLGSVEFPMSPSFKEVRVGKIFLRQGPNIIAIVKDWGYFDVDNIRLEPSEASSFSNVAAALVTPDPTFKTDSLYKLLQKLYGKVILSGQYGGASEFDKIKNISGRTPAMRGFDLIEYSPSRVAFGSTSAETEKAIEWHQQRGIVTFAWHWNAPKDLINQPGKEWWRGFYTEATTFDVTKAMSNTSSEEYTLILRDIDAIAVQLKKLKNAGVPVLWRPLHEAEGKWFWWGAKGPEACKWLWKLLFDRLVIHHQLNNLIWVWTSTGTADALNWYPGDDYVDIIGADIYLPAGTYSSSFITFDNIAALYQGRKIITLSENGPIPDPENLFVETAAWSWFGTWSGDFILNGVYNSAAHINKIFNHEYVITLDEIDDIDSIVEALQKKREAEIEEEEEAITGISENGVALSFQNPVRNERLIIKTWNSKIITDVTVYNVQGRIEPERQCVSMRGDEAEINFETKAAGLYVVKVTMGGSVRIFRIVKL
jgi:mannan endo-1,4-beta-mannosidase